MVDQIKNNIASSTKSVSQTNTSGESNKTVSSSSKLNLKSEQLNSNSTNISKFISKEAIKDMSVQPPIDKEKVSRIKNAIANNNYPIDLEKISDALMDAYKEMK
tara:strand:+ start:1449 stop:1760 length:312 start_codon:yes stop_codon:yes gene_type:complete